MNPRKLVIGKIPRRTRRHARLIKRETRVRYVTLREGMAVALGHGRGCRLGRILHFHHELGTLEARVEWSDGIVSSVRADALRKPTHKDRKRR